MGEWIYPAYFIPFLSLACNSHPVELTGAAEMCSKSLRKTNGLSTLHNLPYGALPVDL